MEPELPVGWTIERLRSVSGDPEATVLSRDRQVTVERPGQTAANIDPVFVLVFHDLALVQARDDGDWYMGMLHTDGAVSCWASYGQNLDEAIRGL
jgi:hypothetical protein